MVIGVVIVSYNSQAYLHDCLESLRAQTARPAHIIVVDNASSDDTPLLVTREFPEVTLLRSESNLGFTGGANAGLRRCLDAACDAVFLLNPDAVVKPEAFQVLLEGARRHPGAVVVPTICFRSAPSRLATYAGDLIWWRGRMRASSYGQPLSSSPPADVRVQTASGCCLLLPADVLREVGLFDEAFFLYFEDADLLARAGRCGRAVWWIPGALVLHDESRATGGRTSALAWYYYARNRHYFVRKHRRRHLSFAAFVLYSTCEVALRCLWFWVTGQSSLAAAVTRGAWHGWRGVVGPDPGSGTSRSPAGRRTVEGLAAGTTAEAIVRQETSHSNRV